MDNELIKTLPTELLKQVKNDILKELRHRNLQEKIITSVPGDNPTHSEGYNAEIQKYNSENLLSVRGISKQPSIKQRYFNSLMGQDWSSIYPRDSDIGAYYVYAHVNPSLPTFHVKEC